MPIPENQLDTWANIGSITQSSSTYNTIKSALEAKGTPYAGNNYSVFLQGSYGNDTNIYSESDVDIVIKLEDTFFHDLSDLPQAQQSAFESSHSDSTYTYDNFRKDVLSVLEGRFGKDAKEGKKAIMIEASGGRRKADVIAAVQYRRYHNFTSVSDQDYHEGICFYTSSGEQIANYPKQHSANLTRKHQNTSMQFKPMVRVLKNMRSRLISDGMLANGVAPSYYLEGLLYNAPNELFGKSYADTFVNTINWIRAADRSNFVCANEQYYLLREGSPVTWRADKCDAFLNASVELWNQW